MVVDSDHGTVDSPLHPSQLKVYPWVPEALSLLNRQGFGLAIATNQPAFAKGKTTRQNLEQVHQKVVEIAEGAGAKILSSHICFHRSEDGCLCRKPKTGLLEEALARNPQFNRQGSWMVGDGVHDVQAGHSLQLNTFFIGSQKWDIARVFENHQLKPTGWAENLLQFAEQLTSGSITRFY